MLRVQSLPFLIVQGKTRRQGDAWQLGHTSCASMQCSLEVL